MEVWKFILAKLTAEISIIVIYVLNSEGSSPGRQGFKIAVAADGEICGTIGGGIMEYKLVEKAKTKLQKSDSSVLLQNQFHDKEKIKDQSGMICSGSQLNAFFSLSVNNIKMVEDLITGKKKAIKLSPKGIELTDETSFGLQYKSDTEWIYTEAIHRQPVIHIIGGGHVGLALSELMNYLGFYIKLYDDRQELNTITDNSFAHEKHLVDYDTINTYFNNTQNDFVVIMTVGYRTDKIVLKQLLKNKFYYLGLLGSEKKIETLLDEFDREGVPPQLLKLVHTPIGINIFSKTAKEIAVSIAAEIIMEKNKNLSTGRK